MKKTGKFQVVTLGCRTNQYESQAYQDQLLQMGLTPANKGDEVDLCIVNTCTVTENADKSSRTEIRQLAKKYPRAKIVVTGCAAERDPDTILNLPNVSHVIPNKEKEHLLSKVFPEEELPEFSIKNFDDHTRAFVKVQDGCNSYCTYCIIPYVRGRSRSRNVSEILQEVRELVRNGYKEIVLTGINIGDYDGGDPQNPVRLSDLVKLVDKIPGVERLRLSSIDPDEVDDELMDAIISGKNTCLSLHIVLQSGSNIILKRMNRKYTRHLFMETIDRLRQASKDFTFTTDVIVGFPGESESDFNETLEVMKEVKFAKVHMFPYSDRPRTRSALMPNKVSPDVIKERKQIVLRFYEKMAFQLRQQFLGRTMKILTESSDGDFIFGHTDNFLEVKLPKQNLQPNQILNVKLDRNTESGFLAQALT